MKNKFKVQAIRRVAAILRIAGFIALAAVIGFTAVACDDGNGGGGGTTYVSFQSLTQNGSSSRTTTELTLRFDRAIPGLRNSDITIKDRDRTYRFYGTLSGSNPYYMSVPIEASGSLIITVEKSGYNISPSSKTVYVYYAAPTPTYSLEGSWQLDFGYTIYVSGSTGTITQIGTFELIQNAVSKGYVRIGAQAIRNLSQTGDRKWSGQLLGYQQQSSGSNICTGTVWENTTFSLSADARTLTTYTPGFEDGEETVTWTRR
jgi:hypothetical protein